MDCRWCFDGFLEYWRNYNVWSAESRCSPKAWTPVSLGSLVLSLMRLEKMHTSRKIILLIMLRFFRRVLQLSEYKCEPSMTLRIVCKHGGRYPIPPHLCAGTVCVKMLARRLFTTPFFQTPYSLDRIYVYIQQQNPSHLQSFAAKQVLSRSPSLSRNRIVHHHL